jgi:hypothetical protein
MKNDLYPKTYGSWGGNPTGYRPDYKLCCEQISIDTWHRGQCSRKRGFGPDEAYCKQHDPEVIAARQKKSELEYNKKMNQAKYGWEGHRFYDVLEKIANGHNDARGLATETIENFKKGLRSET